MAPRAGTLRSDGLVTGSDLRRLAVRTNRHGAAFAAVHALPRLRALVGPHVQGRRGGYLAAQADILHRVIHREAPGV